MEVFSAEISPKILKNNFSIKRMKLEIVEGLE